MSSRRFLVLVTVVPLVSACSSQWRAQPPFDERDPATYVGPYSYALGRVSALYESVVLWRPPDHVGQTGCDTALWAPSMIRPLLTGGPHFLPRRFAGVCGRGFTRPDAPISDVYDVELRSPTRVADGAIELTILVRSSLAEAPCDTAFQRGIPPSVYRFRAWRNAEGRWRVDDLDSADSNDVSR